jgi:O-antigen/teichoic acid export membrane protein
MSAFLSSIIAISISLSKESQPDKSEDGLLSTLQTKLLKILVIVGIVFLGLSPLIMPTIHTPVLYALPILLMILISIPITTISGYFNGKKLLIKLGSVAVISAFLQFVIGILAALLFKNGLITLLCMSMAQILAVIALYIIYSRDNLPTIHNLLKATPAHLSNDINHLIRYTVVASFAIMAVNLLQISDLLILQRFGTEEAKFYTDIYVISRIVFFAGMIFIWPFLGEISLQKLKANTRPFVILLAIFLLIMTATILGLFFGGHIIMHIMFGTAYQIDQLRAFMIPSVIFKVAFLIVTATCLYFIVLRSYMAILVALIPTLGVLLCILITPESSYITLLRLTAVSIASAIISCILLFVHQKRKAIASA